MLLGIVLSIASIAGIVYGVIRKNKILGIASAITLAMVIIVWVYFYNNPY